MRVFPVPATPFKITILFSSKALFISSISFSLNRNSVSIGAANLFELYSSIKSSKLKFVHYLLKYLKNHEQEYDNYYIYLLLVYQYQ